jgi:PKHD-type hydroxylase
MIIQIPDILTPDQLHAFRVALKGASWSNGLITAGHQGASVKYNEQLPQESLLSQELGEIILKSLQQNPLFISAALPLHIMPPFFNRYKEGHTFGNHIDGAIRSVPTMNGGSVRIRTDLSATLFLNDPKEYEGGELVIHDTLGTHHVKLEAGTLFLYPASSLHAVTPITQGERLGAFFWIQSMIRHNEHRTLLYDLDSSIRHLTKTIHQDPSLVSLTGIYHNLLRSWAEV